MVSQVGFEPTTRCLEGSRSIQLSYWDKSRTHKFYDKSNLKTSHFAVIYKSAQITASHFTGRGYFISSFSPVY